MKCDSCGCGGHHSSGDIQHRHRDGGAHHLGGVVDHRCGNGARGGSGAPSPLRLMSLVWGTTPS
jgi:hypothetical protein